MKATTIRLVTEINAPIGRVFDLSRSIDLHVISTEQTGEQAIAGVTSGLIGLGETVTWRAKHFGVWQQLTTIITEFDPPNHFTDEMVKGVFKSICHEHHFEAIKGITLMKDIFIYEVPFGLAGVIFNKLILKRYMARLLATRNKVIKTIAESNEWEKVLAV
ncbi:cell division protein [Mucilaginibacter hurinus]|uniref:Cell division protein n=1 Tax=Mucilaginibacter hurinus TaxID=2201324 RepID=A0A367GNB2_9SPHI|nr:SRPBCC family protein [Mucilaginibacter hurinus]RCH54800.1 cell division protein [Mucilaginibacter hurinus]